MHVLVVGGGPGGYASALLAAHQGLEVTLIERAEVGGTCLNAGCIPTKSLLETASSWSKAVAYGWIEKPSMPARYWRDAMERKVNVVKQLTAGVKSLLRSAKVRTVHGTAKFKSHHEVLVSQEEKEELIAFDKAILATGSQVAMPNLAGMEQQGVYTSDKILSIEQIPQKLVIVGGGVIGLEFATLFHQIGSHVDIVEFAEEILPRFDRASVRVLKSELHSQGIGFYTRSSVQQIEQASESGSGGKGGCGGGLHVTVRDAKAKQFTLSGDAVLVAVGRVPKTDLLGLEQIGVRTDRERIQTDLHCQTSVPDIYAIGDCSNPVMLAHAAIADAHVAVDDILGRKNARKSHFLIPQCIYSLPEFASVGMTEEEAAESGISYDVSEVPMKANGKALIAKTDGICRIIYEQNTGIVLGIHLVGPHVTELAEEAALALEMEVTVKELAQTIHAHPTVSEVLHEAALVSIGMPVHVPKKQKEVTCS
jgi:dihydrolipoamide dehydrogenase